MQKSRLTAYWGEPCPHCQVGSEGLKSSVVFRWRLQGEKAGSSDRLSAACCWAQSQQHENALRDLVCWIRSVQPCSTAEPNPSNQIGPCATATCVKLCRLENLLATQGRFAIPYKNRNACFKIWTFPRATKRQLPGHGLYTPVLDSTHQCMLCSVCWCVVFFVTEGHVRFRTALISCSSHLLIESHWHTAVKRWSRIQ